MGVVHSTFASIKSQIAPFAIGILVLLLVAGFGIKLYKPMPETRMVFVHAGSGVYATPECVLYGEVSEDYLLNPKSLSTPDEELIGLPYVDFVTLATARSHATSVGTPYGPDPVCWDASGFGRTVSLAWSAP